MTVEQVIFDCDGVLVDSKRMPVEVSTEHGLPMQSQDAAKSFRGEPMQMWVEAIEALLARRPQVAA